MTQQANTLIFNEHKYLLSLVNAAVNENSPPSPPRELDWEALFRLAKDNSFAAVIYPCVRELTRSGIISQALEQRFSMEYQVGLAQDLNQLFELDKILAFCEQAHIASIILKGGILKELYPQTYMRYMGDIDLWVEESGLGRLDCFLKADGYTLKSKSGLHDEYVKAPYIALEVHKKLVPAENKFAGLYNNEMIKRAVPYKNYTYAKKLSQDDFYIYLIDHAAKHFYGSGIVPRMLLDFYIFHKTQDNTVNKDTQAKLLDTLSFTTFELRLRRLAFDWFSPAGTGLSNDNFSLYIINNGSFGRNKNFFISRAVRETAHEDPPSKIKYALRRLFPSYKMLRGKFPVLEKNPALTPLMYFPWWVTWFDTLFIKKNLDYKTLKHLNDIDGESTQGLRALYKEMELDYRR